MIFDNVDLFDSVDVDRCSWVSNLLQRDFDNDLWCDSFDPAFDGDDCLNY